MDTVMGTGALAPSALLPPFPYGCTAGNDAYLAHSANMVRCRHPGNPADGPPSSEEWYSKGIRLFVDFLKHEMRVSVLHGRIHVPAGPPVFPAPRG